jgi:Xaa-Pro aminopeptidase
LQQWEEKVAGAVQLVPLTTELRGLRRLKSEDELRALERAAELNERAFAAVLPLIRPGIRESEVALELEIALRRFGGEEKSFDFIVASGERGAMPHGVASDRSLRAGELVTIDFGTRYGGYCSDETVTLAIGEVSAELRRIYDLVLEAHDRAIDAVQPGVALSAIDTVARELITAAGYGPCFGHGLGHGVGLEIHEAPVVSQRGEDVAAENMVITIEPGIYVEGLGGVRIEDTVVVTPEGCRRLTRIPKSFRSLPA